VCHEAEHRASMVPNLHEAKQERNADYWRNWIRDGKAGSLMPAFAQTQNGPLLDEQINSLVEYLLHAMPTKPASAVAAPAAKASPGGS
jgi:mono/diheme cytochrome c family protein